MIAFAIGTSHCKNGKRHGKDSVDGIDLKKGFLILDVTYPSLLDPDEEAMPSLLTPTNFGHASFRNES